MVKKRINQLYDRNREQLQAMSRLAIKACKEKLKAEDIDPKELNYETTMPVPVWNVAKRYFGIEVIITGNNFEPRRYFVRVYVQSPTIANIRGTSDPELVEFNI